VLRFHRTRAPAFRGMNPNQQRFAGMANMPVALRRTVFFDEDNSTDTFFMAVEGQLEHVFDPNAPLDIVATQGTVEEWIVQNRTQENHAFHFHHLHFLVESQDNFEINGSEQAPAITGQYLDMIQVPFWDGNPSHPFPSVTLRIDFRGPDVGDFVFHCHILEHEDGGMMAIIRVQNANPSVASLGTGQAAKAAVQPQPRSTTNSPMSMEIGNHMADPQAMKKSKVPAPDPRKTK
jgi:FtsP/CotA-like multicopper oxidase with cupredoxin domain